MHTSYKYISATVPLAREACGSQIPVVSPEYSSETPSERGRFPEEISLSTGTGIQ